MTLRVRQRNYGLTFEHEGPGGHTKALGCVWLEVPTRPGPPHWHVFRCEFGDDKPLRIGDGLEEFREARFQHLGAALMWLVPELAA